MVKITNNDYKQILTYYNKIIPNNTKLLKLRAEKILATKLCKCIKKVDSVYKKEPISIGICTKTVLKRKGFTRGKFKCKGTAYVKFSKMSKTRKNT